MNIKILFIFLVLVLIINNSKAREGLSDDYMTEVSGGLLKKKDKTQMKNKFDPSSSTFEDDVNSYAQEKATDDRAYVVSEDNQEVEDVDASQDATVDQTIDGEDQDEDEGSGCNDILLFGLLLLSVIYIVFIEMNNSIK
jgi:hypothetical protein